MSRIAVVGGGFAGFWAAVAARRVAPDADVQLISDSDQLVLRPRLYEADPATLAEPLRPLLELVGVDFVDGRVDAVDGAARSITLHGGTVVDYDAAVIAVGSRLRRPSFDGAAACHSIDDLPSAIAFDEALRTLTNREPCIAVIGAGFTGIELALELRDRLAIHVGAETASSARILLIDRADVVGSELGGGPRPAIEAALDDARVAPVLNATVAAVDPGQLTLTDGRRFATDLVVLCTGMEANRLGGSLGVDVDVLGRERVDEYLRIVGHDMLFAAGDVAAADAGDGHVVMQSCQHALLLGRFAGENAARSLQGKPLLRYQPTPYVTCLALGRSGAVLTAGWDRVPIKTGDEAGAIKRNINTRVIYPDASAGRDGLIEQSRIYGPGADPTPSAP